LLRRDEELAPFQVEMAERIETEIARLKTLTGGLLSFSSSKEGRRRLVDLKEISEEVLSLLRFELQRQAITLETDFAELPLVDADPNKLKQVVINLVMNAAQAMHGEGKIVLRTCRHGEGRVELAVVDNGPGIPAEIQEQIFNPFFTTKPEGEGTGLGLYLCRNIVREHGGEILVESAPGAGTTFRVRLPLQ
jgi:signal transduction histidine kinase